MTQIWESTEYAPRNGQNSNQMYPGAQLALQQYPHGSAVNYLSGNEGNQYPAMSPTYSQYPMTYISQNGHGPFMYVPNPGTVSMPCQMQPPPGATLPSQPRNMSQHGFYPSMLGHRTPHPHPRLPLASEITLNDTEDQESVNQDTMRSEPVNPPLEGYPKVNEFDDLVKQYVDNLSPKKQDKALIHAKRATNIKAVLVDKKTTSVESAQFRFWVKKMFTLEPRDPSTPVRKKKICHEGRPVAVREKLFKILTRAHKQCQHGGRDKTSAQVRRIYSWVPKELISRFVKICPTCQTRRGTSRTSPSASENSVGAFLEPQSPDIRSTSQSRRHSLTTNAASNIRSPTQMSGFSSTFQQQNRWMAPLHTTDKPKDRVASIDTTTSAMVNNLNMNMTSPISPENMMSGSLKLTDDPGPAYFSSNHSQTGNISTSFHANAYEPMRQLQDPRHHGDRTYRTKQGYAIKREQPY